MRLGEKTLQWVNVYVEDLGLGNQFSGINRKPRTRGKET